MFVLSEKQTLVSKSHIYLASEYLCSYRMYPVCWGWGRYFCYGLKKKKKFIYLFLITHRLSLVAVSRGYSLGARASHCRGFSCCRAWALGHTGSAVAVLGLSCPEACGIFLDQGSNLSPLRRQVDSTELPGKSLMWHFKISLKS